MEYWDLRGSDGKKTGETITRGSALPEGAYHLVVDIWIRNAQGQYLISRRCPDKFPDPGLWEPTCGSVVAGENSFDAALREVREELGLPLNPARGRCITRVTVPSHTLVDVWLFEQEADENKLIFQPGETDAAQWADVAYIRTLTDEGKFLPRRRLPYLDALPVGVF